jgi:hypothetical protein
MKGGEDWLFRPVIEGMCKLESIFEADGALDLFAIALANEALDVKIVNQRTIEKHLESKR